MAILTAGRPAIMQTVAARTGCPGEGAAKQADTATGCAWTRQSLAEEGTEAARCQGVLVPPWELSALPYSDLVGGVVRAQLGVTMGRGPRGPDGAEAEQQGRLAVSASVHGDRGRGTWARGVGVRPRDRDTACGVGITHRDQGTRLVVSASPKLGLEVSRPLPAQGSSGRREHFWEETGPRGKPLRTLGSLRGSQW